MTSDDTGAPPAKKDPPRRRPPRRAKAAPAKAAAAKAAPAEGSGKAAPAKAPRKAPRKTPAAAPRPPKTRRGRKRGDPGPEPTAGTVVAGGPVAPRSARRAISGDDLRAVVEGWSHDPYRVLGAHPAGAGWVVRTLRPDAVSVAVVDQDGSRYPAHQLHGAGVYEARLPSSPATTGSR